MNARPFSPQTKSRPSPRHAWMITVLLLGILAVYANSLSGPFIYDDIPAIADNPTIRHLWPLTPVLAPQTLGGLTVSGRPVLNLSFALNYAISGDAVWSYHLFNVLVHAGSVLLLFGVVRRTLSRPQWSENLKKAAPGLAFTIAALWALHPLQTQAVTYAVQRAESLMGFFFLLTFYAFARGSDERTHHRDRWLGFSVSACALGMATKEVTAVAPLLVFLYDRTFVAGGFRAAWRARRGYYLGLGATWVALVALLASTGWNRGGTVGAGVGVPWWAYGLTQFEAVVCYLRLSVWPNPLIFEYGTRWAQGTSDVLPYAMVVLPLIAATIVALVRRPVAGFLGAWFFAILAPSSLTPGTIQMTVEHRMYLPLISVLTLVVAGLYTFLGRRFLPTGLALAAFCGVLTTWRNHDYRSALALWIDTAAKRPDNPRAHEALAVALVFAGRLDEAITHRAEVVRLKPDEGKSHYNLALTLAQAGRLEEALRSYRFALKLDPRDANAHNNFAVALGRADRTDEALAHYADAERLQPAEPLFAYNHGVALLRLGRAQEAKERFETAVRLRPDYADAHFNLHFALVSLGQFDAAFAHLATAARLRPQDGAFHAEYGWMMGALGHSDAAAAEFRKVPKVQVNEISVVPLLSPNAAPASHETALQPAPENAMTHLRLGNALIGADRVSEALVHYEAAVRLAPADAEAHHNLGIAYARLDRMAEAGREFETALRLRPGYAEAERHLAQVREILGAAGR